VFGYIDRLARTALGFGIASFASCPDLSARVHKLFDQCLSIFWRKSGIAQAPKPACHNEVASVWRAWMFRSGGHGRTIPKRIARHRTAAQSRRSDIGQLRAREPMPYLILFVPSISVAILSVTFPYVNP
jgi:hypothetical protein